MLLQSPMEDNHPLQDNSNSNSHNKQHNQSAFTQPVLNPTVLATGVQSQPHVTGMPQMFNVGRVTSFDLLLAEEELQDGNNLINSLPFYNSLRSLRSNQNGEQNVGQNSMKEEHDLSLAFDDSNPQMKFMSKFPVQSGRSVDFSPIENSSNAHVNPLHSSTPNIPIQEDVEMQEAGHKRTGADAGFASRRNYGFGNLGESLRSQSQSFLNTLRKPFSLKKKKSKTEAEETQSTEDNGNEGGKHYSRIENVVLVGEIYTQLFINPALKKQTWTVIASNFAAFFSLLESQQPTCTRTAGALERHFKVLKEQNRKEGGTMFVELYEEYKSLKRSKMK